MPLTPAGARVRVCAGQRTSTNSLREGNVSRIRLSIGFALVFVLVPFAFGTVQAQSTSFTYQGRLTDGGNPANGNYDLQFSLFDAGVGGNQIGLTLSRSNTQVTA